jgi:hypothetical protein
MQSRSLGREATMKNIWCRIGIHKGISTKIDEQNESSEINFNSAHQIKEEEFKCVRCNKVYIRLIGVDPTFFGHP